MLINKCMYVHIHACSEVCNINVVLSSLDYQDVGSKALLSLKRLVQDPCSPDFYSPESACMYIANMTTISISAVWLTE